MSDPRIYLFFGEEDLLVEEATAATLAQFSGFGQEIFRPNGSMEELLATAGTGSLFASQVVIVAKNPAFLLGKADDKVAAMVKTVCDAVIANGHALILSCPGERPDQRRKVMTQLKKVAKIEEFSPFKDWEQLKLYAWIKARVQKSGKTINDEAVFALAEVGGNNLRALANQIQMLLVYIADKPAILVDDVHAVSGGASQSIFNLQEALKNRDLSKALLEAKRLIEAGEESVGLMGLIASTLRLYLQLLLGVSEKKSARELAQSLGRHPFFVEKLLPSVRKNYDLPTLRASIHALHERDFELKTGKRSPESALELCLVDCLARRRA